MNLDIVLLDKNAVMPTRNYESDAGIDLYTLNDIEIPSKCFRKVRTGVAIALPKDTFGFVVGRSGITSKGIFRVQIGTIDEGYRGEISIMVDSVSYKTQFIPAGTKLAQLVIIDKPKIELNLIDGFQKETERGAKGFGSSGE